MDGGINPGFRRPRTPRGRRRHRLGLAIALRAAPIGLLAASLAALGMAPAAATSHRATIRRRRPSVTCDKTFHIVATPLFKGHDDMFDGVAAITATDAWAVGQDVTINTGSILPLVEHWDGTAWTTRTVPLPSDYYDQDADPLRAVVARSSSDVWAVGDYYSLTAAAVRTLIEHWDGAHWKLFALPEPANISVSALSVTAISAGDAWLVGNRFDPTTGAQRTFAAHWNGTKWAVVKSPNKGFFQGQRRDYLTGVSGSSSTDVWAVGGYVDDVKGAQPLTLHFGGTAWSVVTSPQAYQLSYAAAISPTDVLTTGTTPDIGDNGATSAHWNGTKWQTEAVPPPYPDQVNLAATQSGLAAASSTDAWLVSNDNEGTLTDQWDGTAWTQVASENPAAVYKQLTGVSVLSDGTTAFAAGYSQKDVGFPQRTLAEIYC